MANLSKQSSDNIGSVVKIEIVKARDVVNFPAPGDLSVVQSSITLKQGVEWENIYFTHETAQCSDNDSLGDGGNLAKFVINGNIPKVNDVSDTGLKEYANHPLIVKVTDGNGTCRVFGRPDQPCMLQFQRSTPALPAGYNGYNFSINGEQMYTPVFLT